MNYKILIILLFIALIGLAPTPKSQYSVKFVYDGDTFLTGTDEKVRYLGIDAPEMGYEDKKSEFMALVARAENIRLIKSGRVTLEFDQVKKDRYGRLLAYVYLENGDMVNALLVRKGLAHVSVTLPNLKYFRSLLDYQREAMKARIGIWRAPEEKAERLYLGNLRSYRFHRPVCPFAKRIGSAHRLKFGSREEAFWEGFSPCSKCLP